MRKVEQSSKLAVGVRQHRSKCYGVAVELLGQAHTNHPHAGARQQFRLYLPVDLASESKKLAERADVAWVQARSVIL